MREIDLPFWKGTLREKKSSALSVFIERTKVFGNGKSTLRVSKYKDRKGTPKEIEIDLNYAKEAL